MEDVDLFLAALEHSTKTNGFNLKQRRFCLNIKRGICEGIQCSAVEQSSVPWKVVDLPVFKQGLDSLLQRTLKLWTAYISRGVD